MTAPINDREMVTFKHDRIKNKKQQEKHDNLTTETEICITKRRRVSE